MVKGFYAQYGGFGVLFPSEPTKSELEATFGADVVVGEAQVTPVSYDPDQPHSLAAALAAIPYNPDERPYAAPEFDA